MEDDWSSDGSTGCMHGYFRSTAPRGWFSGHPSAASTVPAVFLFNSSGNSTSPQFFGPELSSSYSIVAHEVGHYISWQYGGWSGPAGTELARSLNEGHSMVLAALLGKQHFSALEYDESEYVTTGSKTAGEQWSHFVYGQTPLRYSAMDCVDDDAYYVAWPFVQAMWRLMNNMGPDGDADLGQCRGRDRQHRRPVHVQPAHVHVRQHDDVGQALARPARPPVRPHLRRDRAGPARQHLLRRLQRASASTRC